MIGSTLRHYTVEARLGEGGMGAVYRARDTVLNRTVAIKVLASSASADTESVPTLLHEARAASALNHPHIVTIHAVEQHDDISFIVMEHVRGEPLGRAIPAGGFEIDRALAYACDIADALAAAHQHGIVHRDLKPGNVMLTSDGRIKVLDFGLARRTSMPDEATRTLTLSAPGHIVGTPGYLAPETIMGQPAGPTSDVFALGAVIYHVLTGTAPFSGESIWAALDRTLHHDPPALTTVRPDIPAPLARIVARALDKDPARRYPSARELHDDLLALRRERGVQALVPRPAFSRKALAAAILLVLAGSAALAWWRVRENRITWARETALEEITRLAEAGEVVAAYRLAEQALATAPDDPRVQGAWTQMTSPFPVTSKPDGADVALRSYSAQDEGWIDVGKTPTTKRVPLALMRWRITKDGYEPLEIAPAFPGDVQLVPAGTAPAGMVYVPAGHFELSSRRTALDLPEYWIDKFEITNRQFKAFVDAAGYRKREYWTHPFVKDGRVIEWDAAMEHFKDPTGRPGPSTWELGAYRDGEDDWPVSGVSWYEAAAYAAYAGKSLPTVYHWFNASGAFAIFSDILRFSNFGGRGTTKAGATGGLGPYGTYDMAGNVKEWVWNEGEGGLRFVLGGAWNEAPHQFMDEDARSPFERGPGFGFRCMLQRAPIDATAVARINAPEHDPSSLKPVGDDVFAAYVRLYQYDPIPLEAAVDERNDSQPHWISERVTFRAAYGSERVPLMLFLPRSAKPPYQTVVFFPGGDANRLPSSRAPSMRWLDFLLRDGRAVAFPVYQQTYERRKQPRGPNFAREISIQRGLDLRRTIDYLESRSDIDRDRIAFYGLSLGAQLAPVYLVVEPRLRTGVLFSGGFETWTIPPETDPVHFAPRVRQPVLMVNGREDFDLPYQTAQIPLFKALGTAAADKRHTVLEGGHLPSVPQLVFKEILDWLDKYLGPVNR